MRRPRSRRGPEKRSRGHRHSRDLLSADSSRVGRCPEISGCGNSHRWSQLVSPLLLLIAIVAVAATWSPTLRARESERARVNIQRPAGASQLLQESVELTLGELNAFGMDARVLYARSFGEDNARAPLAPGLHGVLSMWDEGNAIAIEAWAPDGGAPASVRVDTTLADTSPTVISIRAVEALRAKWLQHSERLDSQLPAEAIKFAKAERPLPERVAQPSPPPESGADADPEPEPSGDSDSANSLHIQLQGGPNWLTAGKGVQLVNGDVGLLVGRRWLSLGAAFRGPLSRATTEAIAGSADVGLLRFLGVVRAELDLLESVTGYAHAGWGATTLLVDASPNPGFEVEDGSQTEFSATFALGFNLWLHDAIGLYAEGEVNVLANEVVILMDGMPTSTVDALSVGVGVGACFRLQ